MLKKVLIATFSLVFVASVALVGLGFFNDSKGEALAQTATIKKFKGQMWSDNIGWINASSTGHLAGLTMDTEGRIRGQAWSDHIGWVSFPDDNHADISLCGIYGVRASLTNGNLSGWARAIAGTNESGWNGCINFGTTQGSAKHNFVTGTTSGAAWGDDVVGWVTLAGLTTGPEPVTQYYCTGTRPALTSVCVGDDQGLTSNVQWSSVTSSENCSDQNGPKCQYYPLDHSCLLKIILIFTG